MNAWDLLAQPNRHYANRPAPIHVRHNRRGAYDIQAHEVTKAELPGDTTRKQRENAFYLAASWGVAAIERMGFDVEPEEIAYCARCAAHFANLALRFRS